METEVLPTDLAALREETREIARMQEIVVVSAIVGASVIAEELVIAAAWVIVAATEADLHRQGQWTGVRTEVVEIA